MAGQIAGVRALHDYNDRAWPFRVEPVWQLLRPEADDLFALHAALDFQYVMRIVIDDDVATPAGDRGHRAGEAIAAPVVLETRLLVLIRRQREALAPVLLIPWRLDQAPAFGAVARGQVLPIGNVQELYPRPEPALRIGGRAVEILTRTVCPYPGGEEHIGHERFHMARRQVDQQPQNLLMRDGLEMLTQTFDVPIDVQRARLDPLPACFSEFEQIALTG